MSIRILLLTPTVFLTFFAVQPQSASYAPTLKFDVTSIRRCSPGLSRNSFQSPLHSGSLAANGVWVAQLIGAAYGVDYRSQIFGGPDWVQAVRSNDIRFNVQAKSDSTTDDRLAKLSDDLAKLEKEHMLQALLEDRFGLKAHFETREAPAYALTISKGGTKLERANPIGPNAGIESDPDS